MAHSEDQGKAGVSVEKSHRHLVIDLGPEGGEEGGEVIATGTPEEVAKVKDSYTGQFLAAILPSRARTGKTPAGSTNGSARPARARRRAAAATR